MQGYGYNSPSYFFDDLIIFCCLYYGTMLYFFVMIVRKLHLIFHDYLNYCIRKPSINGY